MDADAEDSGIQTANQLLREYVSSFLPPVTFTYMWTRRYDSSVQAAPDRVDKKSEAYHLPLHRHLLAILASLLVRLFLQKLLLFLGTQPL